jgi:hypothetical protein
MEQNTKENGLKKATLETVVEYKYGPMEVDMKDIGGIIEQMEKVG